MSRLQRLVICTLLAAAVASVVLAGRMRDAAADSNRIVAGDAVARADLAAEQAKLAAAAADVRRLKAATAHLRRATAGAEARLRRAIALTRHARVMHRAGSVRVRYVRLRTTA
jgi:hypothetical protein